MGFTFGVILGNVMLSPFQDFPVAILIFFFIIGVLQAIGGMRTGFGSIGEIVANLFLGVLFTGFALGYKISILKELTQTTYGQSVLVVLAVSWLVVIASIVYDLCTVQDNNVRVSMILRAAVSIAFLIMLFI
ncbi:hypothetical protein CO179_05470 [candidate division WWE3 bacterium CG_4_9_14_3_um_filter_39_7]|nr:MAG: hypothetical protein CO179_05470 [candidate division WWE3 bacterium CG_4_9_14_3_um_filter_39_7]